MAQQRKDPAHRRSYRMQFHELQRIYEEGAEQPVTKTPAFKAWFGDWENNPKAASKVVDADGRPAPVYHGSGTEIRAFRYEYTELGHQQLGSGFYFTTNKQRAVGYTTRRIEDQPKPGGEDKPSVIEVYLNIRNPLDAKKTGSIPRAKVRAILLGAPDLDDSLNNIDDVSYVGRAAVLNQAIGLYANRGDTIMRTLNTLSSDFFTGHVKEFNQLVKKHLGYDGVKEDFDGETHWVAWFPSQIKSVKAKSFDPSSDQIDEDGSVRG